MKFRESYLSNIFTLEKLKEMTPVAFHDLIENDELLEFEILLGAKLTIKTMSVIKIAIWKVINYCDFNSWFYRIQKNQTQYSLGNLIQFTLDIIQNEYNIPVNKYWYNDAGSNKESAFFYYPNGVPHKPSRKDKVTGIYLKSMNEQAGNAGGSPRVGHVGLVLVDELFSIAEKQIIDAEEVGYNVLFKKVKSDAIRFSKTNRLQMLITYNPYDANNEFHKMNAGVVSPMTNKDVINLIDNDTTNGYLRLVGKNEVGKLISVTRFNWIVAKNFLGEDNLALEDAKDYERRRIIGSRTHEDVIYRGADFDGNAKAEMALGGVMPDFYEQPKIDGTYSLFAGGLDFGTSDATAITIAIMNLETGHIAIESDAFFEIPPKKRSEIRTHDTLELSKLDRIAEFVIKYLADRKINALTIRCDNSETIGIDYLKKNWSTATINYEKEKMEIKITYLPCVKLRKHYKQRIDQDDLYSEKVAIREMRTLFSTGKLTIENRQLFDYLKTITIDPLTKKFDNTYSNHKKSNGVKSFQYLLYDFRNYFI